MTLTGKQRLRQVRVKAHIHARRELRKFLAGAIPWLPCAKDYEDAAIAAEFDRAYQLGFDTALAAARQGGGER